MNATVSWELYPWHQKLWQQLVEAHHSHHLPHALLISGLPGLGQNNLAEIFIAFLLCDAPQALPCNSCQHCHLLSQGNHPNRILLHSEPSAHPSIKIGAIRQLIDTLQQTNDSLKSRFVLMLQAEQMTLAASQALLKILEEPPLGTHFILTSEAAHRLPLTIQSRCQKWQIEPSFDTTTQAWLAKQLPLTQDITHLLQLAGGAPLKALELEKKQVLTHRTVLLDQLLCLSQKQLKAVPLLAELFEKEFALWLPLLLSVFYDVVKAQLGIDQQHWLHSDKISHIQHLAKAYSAFSLQENINKITAAQALLASSNQINTKILIEDLLCSLIPTAT